MQEGMPSSWVVRGILGALLALWALFAPTGELRSATAGKPRCRLERVDLSAFDDSGQIKVIGNVVELEGQLVSGKPAKDFRLQVNGKTVARADKLEPFERSGQDLYIALLVEISALYAPAIDKIKDTLKEFLEALPPRAKVKLILFGYEIEQQPTFMPAGAVSPLIDDINPDDQGDVQLINAINAGLAALNKVMPGKDKSGKPAPPPRKVMVVLSDGLNQLMDRKSFKRVGDLLKHSNVPLFPVAFSMRDDRGPLLNLGELAKRSSGTFRWAQADDKLKEQFGTLVEELRQSHVVTFPGKKLDLDDLQRANFTLLCGELKSAPFSLAGLPTEKKSTWWKWVLGIVLTLVGLWGAAQLAVIILRKRAQRMGQMPGQMPGQMQPGQMPPGFAQNATLAPGAQAGFAPNATLAPGAPPGGAYIPVPVTPGARVFSATLIGIGAGQLGGQRIKVDDRLLIGKAAVGPQSLTVPDDPNIGTVHCELRRDGAGYALFEMNPQGGTFLNDRQVAGPTRIADGDIIRLGEATQFRFRLDD